MSKLLKIWLGFILVVGTLERFEVSAAAIAAQDDDVSSEAPKGLKQDDDAAKDSRKKRDLIIPRPYPTYDFDGTPTFYDPSSTYLTNAETNYYPSPYSGLPRYSYELQQIADTAPSYYYPTPTYDPYSVIPLPAVPYGVTGSYNVNLGGGRRRLLGRRSKLRRYLRRLYGSHRTDDDDGGDDYDDDYYPPAPPVPPIPEK